MTGRYSGLGGFLNQVKSAILDQADSDITYNEGVEMTLRLTAPLVLRSEGGPGSGTAKLQPVPDEAG